MEYVRRISALSDERAHALELAVIVFLWQAAVGVYFLSLVQQYLPQELNTGAAFPGYAMACYGVAKFAWQPLAGWVADRIGRRITMVAGMSINLPVLALMMTVPDELAFLAFSSLLGIGAATMWPAFIAHVGDTTPHARRAGVMSALNLAQMAGIGIGTLAGVLMVDFVTYGAAFWVCIGFSLLALLFAARRADAPREPQRVAAERATRRAVDDAAWRPGLGMLALIVLFLTVGTSLHTPMIGAYTRDVLHVKMSYMAMLFPAPAVLAGLAMWRFNRVADRYARQVPLIGGLFVAALAIFALTLTNSPIIVVNLVVIAGVAYAISVPAWGAAALDATDVGGRGLALGVLSAVQGLGVAGGQALGGMIGGFWGPLAPFKLAALLLMAATALIVMNVAAHQRSRARIAAIPAVSR